VRADGRPLPSNSYPIEGGLEIRSVVRDNEGRYMCIGKAENGRVMFETVAELFIVAKPVVILDPQRQVARPGDNPVVFCRVTEGDRPYELVWYKEVSADRPDEVTPLPDHVSHSANSGILQFNGIAASDQGTYVCWVKNSVGEARTKAEVIVQDYQADPEFVSELGGNVNLICRLGDSEGGNNNNYIWQRENGTPIQVKAIQTVNMLRIPNVQPQDAGRYVCRNSQGRIQYVRLVVETAAALTAKEEEIVIRPSNPKAYLGDVFELKCALKGLDKRRRGRQPIYTSWSKVDGYITSPNVLNGGNVIKFIGLMAENSGTYRCRIETMDKVIEKTFDLLIEGQPRPIKK